ncbi:MAG: hypothetical protein ACT4PT_04590 [Methanobacteriota archaeon]
MNASDEERLEDLGRLLAELSEANLSTPVVVEGEKDAAALRKLGLSGEILPVNRGDTVFAVAEAIAKDHRRVILLMDWDDYGGHLSRILREALEANAVRCDLEFRRALVRLTRREIAYVESLDTFVARLRGVPP